MTVSSSTNRNGPYSGNGSTTAFARTFLVTDADHLKVYQTISGVTTEVTSGITKDGIGTASGNVTFDTAPATGTSITLIRETPLTQETDYSAQGVVSTTQVETDLDLAAMRVQDQQEALGRSVKVPVASSLANLELPTPAAGAAIGWNAAGDGMANITGLPDATVSASTDNAIMRYDTGTGGLQDSGATLDDSGNLSLPVALAVAQGGTGSTTASGARTALDAVGLTDTQTLTNKTLTSPVINVTSDAEGDIYYRTAGGAFARLGIGSTDQVLTVASGLPSWEDLADWTQTSFSATTSGTAVDFTSIPSGVNEIDVIIDGVSFSGTDNILVQLGTGGSPETSGYDSSTMLIGSTGNNNSSTAGFITRVSFASNTADGLFRLFRIDGNQWAAHSFVRYQSGSHQVGSGRKSLSGELDMVRVTRDGSNTFDAGQVAIRYK